MNIAVCIKQVPNTEAQVILNDGILAFSDPKKIINPYDEFAIEAALRAKEQAFPDASVTAITLGPESATEALRTALAMGCDQAIHITHEPHPGWLAPLTVGQAIGAALRQVDLVFCGRQGIDHDDFTVPYVIANAHQMSCINVVKEITYKPEEKKLWVVRESDGGQKEYFECPMPAVLGISIGLNKPRYPSLPGIMKAKKKAIESLNLTDLVSDSNCTWIQPSTYELPKAKEACKMIKGDIAEQASELARILKEDLHIV